MQIGPFTLSRGQIVPATTDYKTPQKTVLAYDGSVTVIDYGFPDEEFIRAKVRLPEDEADKIISFLRNGMGYARTAFSIVDGYGDTHVVRFWDRKIRKRVIASNVVELDLLFRKEVVG